MRRRVSPPTDCKSNEQESTQYWHMTPYFANDSTVPRDLVEAIWDSRRRAVEDVGRSLGLLASLPLYIYIPWSGSKKHTYLPIYRIN